MHLPLRTAKGAEGVSICSLGLSLKVGTNVLAKAQVKKSSCIL